jgi:tail sheath protein
MQFLSPGINVSEYDITTIVPAVATTTGVIAGIFNWGPVYEPILVGSELDLRNTFFRPNANNYETWFTAANFLTYSNSLYVVRGANTTSGDANCAMNAAANTTTIPALIDHVIINQNDFLSKENNFDTSVQFVAKWPGAVGNSLRISVCDSLATYSSTLDMNGNTSSVPLHVSANLAISFNSNTATLAVLPEGAGTAADANTYIYRLLANLSIGDIVSLGNTAIGVQYDKIAAISTVTANATGAFANITFEDSYTQSTPFTTSNTLNNSVQRRWEFATLIQTPPQNSSWVNSIGGSATIDTMNVVIVDDNGLFTQSPGAILETWIGLSRATDAMGVSGQSNYYQTVLNSSSAYVWAVNDIVGAASAPSTTVANSTNTVAYNKDFQAGQDGYSEGTAPLYVVTNGYDLVDDPDFYSIGLVLQGKPISGSTVINGKTINNTDLANYLTQNLAQVRKDCVVFITPDYTIISNNPLEPAQSLVNWRDALVSSSYAVMDTGYKYQYDRYNNVYRYVPTNGDIAGLCARTDHTRDPWWSPAGFNRGQINNVVKMQYNPDQTDRDLLYPNGINPVVTFPGQGTILFGDKTLLGEPSAFDRINVRRLFIVLEKAISLAAKAELFEFNDAFTQNQFKNLINPYLALIKSKRGITDYLVVCDSTNNTPEVVDSDEFVGDIYIKPERSINFIQLNFVAVATGVQFSEIVGTF